MAGHRAPTKRHDADHKEIDRYFEKLGKTCEELEKKGYTVIAAGDFNAHVGNPQGTPTNYPGTVWKGWLSSQGMTRQLPSNKPTWTFYSMTAD